MTTLLTILHVTVCLFLMLTVLLQSGKSGGMGAAFGGGNAATVFGGSGASSFLRRLTAGAATIFMLASMTLAFIASHNSGDALEKFGASQADIAAQKEKEKERALGSGAGSNAGSNGSAGSAMDAVMPTESSMSAPGSDAVAPTTGDTPIMGSGFSPGSVTNPTPNPNGTSAANPPAKNPTPTTTGSASVTETPKKTPAPAKADVPKPAPTPAPAAVPAPATPTPAPAQ